MTKIVHLKDVKKANLTKLELSEAVELINQELLDWISSGAAEEAAAIEYEPPAFTLLSGYRRLVTICKAVLEADERGRGLPFEEAMNAMAKEIKYKSLNPFHKRRTSPPKCFGSNPSYQEQAENCCDNCRVQNECLIIKPK